MNEIVVSGVRPTGKLHLGNYFGAVVNFVKMQKEYKNCYFFIADLHSLTTHPNPANLTENVERTLIEYLACGVNPDECILYAQSALPQISELYLVFNMLAYLGELEKVPTFKDKVRSQPENVNAGLLTYPVLMAVDILIHHGQKVPVGKDQMQHIEMTRNFGNRFNHLYKTDYFKEPQGFNFGDKPVSVPSLDGEGKMSKSKGENTCIYLDEEPESIRKKIMKATTSATPTEPNSSKTEAVQNIFDLMKLVSTNDTIQHFEDTYNNCTIRFGDMKKQIAEDMIAFLSPIRENILKYRSDKVLLNRTLNEGNEKARESAAKTMREVREIIGLKP